MCRNVTFPLCENNTAAGALAAGVAHAMLQQINIKIITTYIFISVSTSPIIIASDVKMVAHAVLLRKLVQIAASNVSASTKTYDDKLLTSGVINAARLALMPQTSAVKSVASGRKKASKNKIFH